MSVSKASWVLVAATAAAFVAGCAKTTTVPTGAESTETKVVTKHRCKNQAQCKQVVVEHRTVENRTVESRTRAHCRTITSAAKHKAKTNKAAAEAEKGNVVESTTVTEENSNN